MKPSIKKSYFYDIFYKILTMITPLITAPYLSRVLGADGIGIQSYTHSIATYFVLFGCLGIGSYGSREISRNRDDKQKTSELFWELLLVKFSVFVIVLLGYSFLIVFDKAYSIYYLVLLMTLLANMFSITWFFEGLEQFKVISIRNSFFKILQVCLTLILVKGKNALLIYMVIFSATELISSLSLWVKISKFITKVNVKNLNIKQHYKETFIYFIPAIATNIYCSIDKVMLKWIINDDSMNGYYEQSRKIITIVETIAFSLNSVMASRMSLLFKENKLDEMRQKILDSFNYIFLITMPMLFGLSAISNKFVPLFFGSGYDVVVYLIPLMCPIVAIISISNCLGCQYLTPSGQRAKSTKALIIGMVVNIILNALLIPLFNVYGAVIASLIAEIVITSMYLYMCKDIVKLRNILKYTIKRVIAAIFMFIIVYICGLYLNNTILALLLQVGIGICVYLIILYVLRDNLFINTVKVIYNKIKFYFQKKKIRGIKDEYKN